MNLNLDDHSVEPLQNQIVKKIRSYILNGELQPGYSLLSIRALAKENNVSVITSQKAYEQLEKEGLIHSRRGKGFFVKHIPEDKRKEISSRRLTENLNPLFISSLTDGLSGREIFEIAYKILKNIQQEEK